jgi:hypothetical protein
MESPPSRNCAASLRHADEHSGGVGFPTGDFLVGWLAGTALLPCGTGAEPFCSPVRANNRFNQTPPQCALNWGFQNELRHRLRPAPTRGETCFRPENPLALWLPRIVLQPIRQRSRPWLFAALPSCLGVSRPDATTPFCFRVATQSVVAVHFSRTLCGGRTIGPRENAALANVAVSANPPGRRMIKPPFAKPENGNGASRD